MPMIQNDLFGNQVRHAAPESPAPEMVEMARARLRATLDLVARAETMPWTDLLAIIREDNAFRFAKDLLPPDEAAILWADFDAHMDRLYAVMNAGKEPDLGD